MQLRAGGYFHQHRQITLVLIGYLSSSVNAVIFDRIGQGTRTASGKEFAAVQFNTFLINRTVVLF